MNIHEKHPFSKENFACNQPSPTDTASQVVPKAPALLLETAHAGAPGEGQEPRYWLVKFAPFRTAWAEIVRRGTFTLRGVRSAGARKHLAGMRFADRVLFYHSQRELAVVGVLEVTREAYPDPTSADPHWLTCDFAPVHTLVRPVSLDELRRQPALAGLGLLKQPRLAVMPVGPDHFERILSMSGCADAQVELDCSPAGRSMARLKA